VQYLQEGVHDYSLGADVPNSQAVLLRNEAGVIGSIHATHLQPGHAYTVWWNIWNYPDHCTPGGCNIDDLFTTAVLGTSDLLDGGIANKDGMLNFSGFWPVGIPDRFGDPGLGLTNPMGAQIEFWIRDHGLRVPALADQTNSFSGGCNNAAVGGDKGQPGDFECSDNLASSHPISQDIAVVAPGYDPAQVRSPGDVNGDGKITVADATLALQFVVGGLAPASAQVKGADLNVDGRLTVGDVVGILRKAVAG
jgi:hypothetical protein